MPLLPLRIFATMRCVFSCQMEWLVLFGVYWSNGLTHAISPNSSELSNVNYGSIFLSPSAPSPTWTTVNSSSDFPIASKQTQVMLAVGAIGEPDMTVPLKTSAASPSTATSESPVDDLYSCSQVNDYLKISLPMANPPHNFLNRAIHGSHLEICEPTSTCCTRDMEQDLFRLSQNRFQRKQQDRTIFLLRVFQTKAAKFDRLFRHLLHESQLTLDRMFKQTYGVQYEQNAVVFAELYKDLNAYYVHGGDDLDKKLEAFYLKLFKRVFGLINAAYSFDEIYWDCVTRTMDKLEPFGPIPRKMRLQVRRAFVAARTFVQSMHVGRSVVQDMMELGVTPECRRSLTRLASCPLCAGLPQAKPCEAFCVNVLRGCLVHHSEVAGYWDTFVEALVQLLVRLSGPFSFESVTQQIGVDISEAIMTIQEKGAQISKKVFSGCGRPAMSGMRLKRNAYDLYSTHSDQRYKRSQYGTVRSRRNVTLSSLVVETDSELRKTIGYWQQLPQLLCSVGGVAASGNENCWNGHDEGKYSKALVDSGAAQQLGNPEVVVSGDPPPEVVTRLILRLKMATSKLQAAFKGNNVVWIDNSGLGKSQPSTNDDDDNGSGSGMDPFPPPADGHGRNSFYPDAEDSRKLTAYAAGSFNKFETDDEDLVASVDDEKRPAEGEAEFGSGVIEHDSDGYSGSLDAFSADDKSGHVGPPSDWKPVVFQLPGGPETTTSTFPTPMTTMEMELLGLNSTTITADSKELVHVAAIGAAVSPPLGSQGGLQTIIDSLSPSDVSGYGESDDEDVAGANENGSGLTETEGETDFEEKQIDWRLESGLRLNKRPEYRPRDPNLFEILPNRNYANSNNGGAGNSYSSNHRIEEANVENNRGAFGDPWVESNLLPAASTSSPYLRPAMPYFPWQEKPSDASQPNEAGLEKSQVVGSASDNNKDIDESPPIKSVAIGESRDGDIQPPGGVADSDSGLSGYDRVAGVKSVAENGEKDANGYDDDTEGELLFEEDIAERGELDGSYPGESVGGAVNPNVDWSISGEPIVEIETPTNQKAANHGDTPSVGDGSNAVSRGGAGMKKDSSRPIGSNNQKTSVGVVKVGSGGKSSIINIGGCTQLGRLGCMLLHSVSWIVVTYQFR